MKSSCLNVGAEVLVVPMADRHGPYYEWSRAVAGKTVSRRLTEREAEIYRGWIANRRRLEEIVAQMEQTSAPAGELLLRQATPPRPPRPAKR
jgi:hypothetical protein